MWLRICYLLAVLGLLVACQNNEVTPTSYYGKTQLRAILTQQHGKWLATSCTSPDKLRYELRDEANFSMDAEQLLTKAKDALFIDAEGVVETNTTDDTSFVIKKINRLTLDANRGCSEADYNKIIVRTVGKNPLWFTSIALKGLVLERVNQPALVLPYVVERLPSGQMNFSTDANGQHIELWVAPERCEDEETGELYAMRARLTVNAQTFQGCGYLGAVK